MRNLLLGLVVLGVLFVPAMAKAAAYSDDFDDGVMNSALWSYAIEGDPAGTGLYEGSGVLNFTATGSSNFSSRHYLSTWAFDVNNDFMLRSDFSYPFLITDGGVELGLFRGDITSADFFFAAIDATSSQINGEQIFEVGIGTNGAGEQFYRTAYRVIDSGSFEIRYSSLADLLVFEAFDGDGEMAASVEYPNFKSLGTSPLGIFIGGYSNLAELPEGLAKLDNFNAIGTVVAVTPEPLSSVLFLLGAGGMALARKKRLVRN